MKKNISLLFSAMLLLGMSACKKQLSDVNTDPLSVGPEQFDPNYLLSTAQLNYTGSPDGGSDAAHVGLSACAAFMQHLATTESYEFYGDKYYGNDVATSMYFEEAYPGQVKLVVDLWVKY